jgi:hypothetical protein
MSFPERDEDGRIVGIVDLLAILLAGIVLGLAAVALIDWIFSALGAGRFGALSGWLAAVLPFLLLTEEFRAWRGVRGRIPVAIVSALLGLLVGLPAASAASFLPALFSGGVGATVALLIYGVVWFYGVRRLR